MTHPARLALVSLVSAAAGLLLALGGVATAHAEEPPVVPSSGLVDTTGILDEDRVEQAIDGLAGRSGVHLVVASVADFGGADPQLWTEETARASGALGEDDLVLGIGWDVGALAWSVDQAFPLSDQALDDIAEATLFSGLRDDPTGAIVAYAGALGDALVGGGAPGIPGAPDSTGGGGSLAWLWIVLGLAVVGVVVWLIVRAVRRRRGAPAQPGVEGQESLERRAGRMLVQLDDAVRSGEEELGFAQAQFGEAAAVEFQRAIEQAKASLREAFTIQQRLDDAYPEPADEARAMVLRIIEIAQAAGSALDAQSAAFDDLRELEQRLPAAIPQLDADRAAAAARLPEAQAALAELEARYAEAAIAPVKGNLAQASTLLEFVDARRSAAQHAVAAGDAGEAALAVHDAQASLAQVSTLLGAVGETADALADASAKLETAVAELRTDLEAAERLEPDPAVAGRLPQAVATARGALEAADPRSPAESIARIGQANAALDEVYAAVQGRQAALDRARTQVDATIAAARSAVANAMQFVRTRRGGVGSSARTRVDQADAALQQAMALAASDPVQAIQQAQRAQQLANDAYAYAQQDVDDFQGGWSSGGGGGGIDFGSVLGGILGGMIGGGMRSGGGGGWSSGGGIFRGGGGGWSSGSGGGVRRSGGFSSGGRRGGGGRF